MKNIAECYAMGLYNAAQHLGCEREVADGLSDVARLLDLCGEYFSSRLVSDYKKAELLGEVLDGHVHPLTLEFMLLMFTRRQIKYLPAAAESFRRLCGASDSAVSLRVPFELDAALLSRLGRRLAEDGLIPQNRAENVSFDITIDETLLGGFIAAYGGYQLDASLKTALNKITRP